MLAVARLLALAATAVAAGGGDDTVISYDRAGVHLQCREAPRAYMLSCVWPSDFCTKPPPPTPPHPGPPPLGRKLWLVQHESPQPRPRVAP